MIRDHHTNTPDQAAAFAQSQAYRADTDYDPRDDLEPREVVADDHECPGEDCQRLLCVLARTVARQREEREEQRAWDEYKASQRDEEAS